MVKDLPFDVDRQMPVPLVTQISQGVQRAVSSGYYRAGDRLPNLDDMAASLSVARQTVRSAIGTLSRHGVVVARSRSGITVVDRGRRTFLHHVLLMLRGGPSYYFGVRSAAINAVLTDHHVHQTRVDLTDTELQRQFPHVRATLAGSSVDCALIDGSPSPVNVLCHSFKVPYIVVGSEPDPAAAYRLHAEDATALGELVSLAQAREVRRVTVVSVLQGATPAHRAFEAAGFDIEALSVIASDAKSVELEVIERAAMDRVRRYLASGERPDLMLFTDDYVARGGLLAILAAGVEVPREMRVAIYANRGYSPVFPVSLTRIEMDPMAHGETIAGVIVARLRGERIAAAQQAMSARLVRGESF